MAPLGAAVVAVALLGAVAFVSTQGAQRSALRDGEGQVRSNRDAAVRALTRQADDFTRTVSSYAADPDVIAGLTAGSPAALARVDAALRTLAGGKDSPAAFVTGLTGNTVALYPFQAELIGKNFGFRDWFKGAQRTGAPYVSSGYRSAAAGHPLVVGVAAPVFSESRRVGYVTVLWQLASVRLVADGSRQDDGVAVTVTDQLGQPLNVELTVDGRGQPVMPPISRLTRQALAGVSLNARTHSRLEAAGPVPALGWTVTAMMPTAVALAAAAPLQRSLRLALGVALLIVMLLTGAAIREARSRARDRRLVDAERERLTTLFAASPIGIVECRPDGTITTVNAALAAMLEYTPEELVGHQGRSLVEPDTFAAVEADTQGLLTGRLNGYAADRVYLTKSGVQVPTFVSVIVVRDSAGGVRSIVAFIVDQRIQKQSEMALRASEERLRRVFDEGLVGKLLVDPCGEIIRVNATLARMLGGSKETFVGTSLAAQFADSADQATVAEFLSRADGRLQAEMQLLNSDGSQLWALVALSWLTEDDGRQVLLAQVEVITARRAAEQRLTELALHDELTGLPNRRLLLERCERAFEIARSDRAPSSSVAALFIDLDGFKPINDRHGHERGDQLLADIARDLKTAIRPTDTIARVGGDEFVVLLEQNDGLAHLRALADRITTVVRRQVTTGDTALTVTASVGVARVDLAYEPDVNADQLLRRADAAMYRAKERSRDRHDVFDTELLEAGEARVLLEQAVRDGLRDDRVALVFQPVVDVENQTVVGAEALLRLTAPDGRALPTLPAIVAAEASGLAEILGDRVLQLALTAASTWPEHLSLAVNVSARELTGRDLRSRIDQALRRHDFDPARLILEITESSILSAGPSALAELERLRSRGVKVAIDDFGTAYATLANLTALPVDILKVDASFTAGLPTQRTHAAIVHGIASMAFELGIPCIVEGVETQAQLNALSGLGVQAQGWFWGKPLGPEHTPSLLRAVPTPRIVPDSNATRVV